MLHRDQKGGDAIMAGNLGSIHNKGILYHPIQGRHTYEHATKQGKEILHAKIQAPTQNKCESVPEPDCDSMFYKKS